MKRILSSIPFLLTLSILVIAIVYLSRRVQYFIGADSAGWGYALFSFLLFYMIAGLLAFSNSSKPAGSIVYKSAAITMALMLYLLISVILVDLAALILDFPPHIMGIIAVGLAVSIILYGFINSFNTRTTEHRIEIQNLKKRIRIAHLSDIHIGHFRGKKFLQRIVDKTNSVQPDLVVITGDFFDGKIRLTAKEVMPLKLIGVPILFVNGNHDVYSGIKDVFSVLIQSGVRVLNNQVTDFEGLQVIGLNHMRADNNSAGMHATKGPTIQDVLDGLNIDKDKPSLLLHHSPDGIEYASRHGIDLYLAGHTHGGQQFPVTLVNELLFRFNRGLHKYNDTQIIVSEGIGTFGPPVRIGTKSEIVVIELSSGA